LMRSITVGSGRSVLGESGNLLTFSWVNLLGCSIRTGSGRPTGTLTICGMSLKQQAQTPEQVVRAPRQAGAARRQPVARCAQHAPAGSDRETSHRPGSRRSGLSEKLGSVPAELRRRKERAGRRGQCTEGKLSAACQANRNWDCNRRRHRLRGAQISGK